MFVAYTGETNERGEPHGQGVKEWVAVTRYDGQWEDGKRHGRGEIKYADGSIYKGEWKDGKRHGRGDIKYADGSIYEGKWKDGKKHAGNFFSSKHDFKGDWKNFAWRMRASFKEGRLDGDIPIHVLMVGDAPDRYPDRFSTLWEDGRLVSVSGNELSAQESLAMERLREEVEQMREIDSNLDEGLN